MKILDEEIISNTDIVKEYKTCRDKAKKFGKAFIFKNNTPDMVLVDIDLYKKFEALMEEAEHIAIYNMVTERRERDNGKRHSVEDLEMEIFGCITEEAP